MHKMLYRSTKDRKIAGVCGGLGEYFDIDPVLFRVLAIVFACTGAGVLAYIICWIVMPEGEYSA